MTSRRDPVTTDLREDWTCVAPRLGATDPCRPPLTLDHVQDGYGRMGKRAPSDRAHLASVCWHHHLDGWSTANRPAIRAYLASVEGRTR